MKRKISLIGIVGLSCTFACLSAFASFSNTPSRQVDAYEMQKSLALVSEDWSKTGGGNYTIENDVIVASGNTAKNENFFINNAIDARGSYDISISVSGNESLPVSKTIDAGIVPWYVDANNYIVVYLNWDKNDRPQDLREIQITGKIDGRNLVRTDNNSTSFTQNQWCDIYTDGMALEPTSAINLSISKTRDKSDNTDSFVISINSTVTGTIKVRDIAKYDHIIARAGVYAYNDTFTFSSFNFIKNDNNGVYQNIGNGIAKSMNNSIAFDDISNSYSFETIDSSKRFENAYIQNNDNLGYVVSFDIELAFVATNYEFGIVASYLDEYTYLVASIKVDGTSVSAGFYGVKKGVLLEKLSIVNIDVYKTINMSLNSNVNLKLQKSGGLYTILLNDIEVASNTFNDFFDAGKVGFALNGIDGTISNFTNDYYFAEYSWEKKTFLSTSMNVSTRLSNSLTYAHGAFVFSSDAVTIDDTSKFARIYYPSSYYGNVTLNCNFNKVTTSSRIGLIPYLTSVDDYISVSIVANKLHIIHHQLSGDDIKTFDIETSISASPSKVTMSVSLFSGLISVSLANKALVENVSFENMIYDDVNSYNIGMLAGGTELEASAIGVDGFLPLDPIDDHDFTFFGQRPSSWSYDYENGVISNKLINGVANGWKATNALFRNTEEIKDLYIASKLQVSKAEGSEYKIGLMPYYKDADNHVIVWLSQWAGAGVKIVMTGRLNGATIGSEWRESGDTGLNLFSANYLEVCLNGDDVTLYLNKAFEPIYKTTFAGLSMRNMSDSFTGFQVGNGMQGTFSEFTMISEERIYIFTEKPSIIETGSRPTEGFVNTKIKLPIYTASNSAGDVLNPTVKVFDPNNTEVTLSKNSFTPTIVGQYEVSVSVSDYWGNVSDPYTYKINIIESDVPIPEPTNPSSSGGLSSWQIALIICGGVLVLGSVPLIIVLVKKSKK